MEQIRGISRNPAMMGEVLRQLADQNRRSSVDSDREKAAIERELEKLAQEMGGLAGLVSSPSPAARSATDRLAALHERAAELEQRLAGVREKTGKAESQHVDSNDLQRTLEEFDPLWEQMTPLEREKFIGALVKQVSYDGNTGTVTVEFRSGGIRSLCENGTARQS